MRYCLDYRRDNQWLDTIDEVNLVFTGSPTEYKNIVKFLEKYTTPRVNLCIAEANFNNFFANNGVQLLTLLHQEHPEYNFAVRFYVRRPMATTELDPRVLEAVSTWDIPTFTGLFADTNRNFRYLLQSGFSEVYVTEDLAFNLHAISKGAHDLGRRIRVIANFAYETHLPMQIQNFFIRPEDVEDYEPYVDIIEIFGEDHLPSIIYGAYLDGEWFGSLNEIIYNLNEPIDNRTIIPIFGEARLNCGRRCLTSGSCSICANLKNISENLASKNLIIRKKADS